MNLSQSSWHRTRIMRGASSKRFIITVATIGVWTILTYYIVIRNHSINQDGKSKFRENAIQKLQMDMEKQSQSREQIIRQYNNLVQIVKGRTTTSSASPVNQINNLAPLEDDTKQIQLNSKIDFNGKYISDDVNFPVIPVIVFACNRVSVSRNLDALIKFRPSREQFPIIVSQVKHLYN